MRRVFAIASVLSLLLCAATVALWVRGMHTGDRFGWTRVAGRWGERGEILSGRGVIRYSRDTASDPFISSGYADSPGAGWEHGNLPWIMHELDSYGSIVSGRPFEWRGFGIWVMAWNGGPLWVSISDWLIVLVTALLPLIWMVVRVARGGARNHGVCSNCSYNLMGNTSGVCPECGTAVKKPAT